MKKSITLTLSDEELMELQRILLDEDSEQALHFAKKHLNRRCRKPLRVKVIASPGLSSQGDWVIYQTSSESN